MSRDSANSKSAGSGEQASIAGNVCAFIHALTLDEGKNHGDWNPSTGDACRIDWAGAERVQRGQEMIRKGTVILHYPDPQDPAHELDWKLSLEGSKAGYTRFSLMSDAMQVVDYDLLMASITNCAGAVHDTLLNCDDMLTDGYRLFTLSLPGKRPIWVTQSWSYGSQAGSCVLTFRVERDRTEEYPCD